MKFTKLFIAAMLACAIAMPALAATKTTKTVAKTTITTTSGPVVTAPAPAPEPKLVVVCYDENGVPYLVWGVTVCPAPGGEEF